MDIKNFGQRLKLEESKTSRVKKEKEVFIETVTLLEHCLQRSDILYKDFNIDIYSYEEYFIKIIENLFLLKYGEVATEIMIWYLYDRVDETGKVYPLIYEEEEKPPVEIKIKTPTDLWKFIDKLLKQNYE
jgi:ATP-dependent Clp protease adapter protein ClpS